METVYTNSQGTCGLGYLPLCEILFLINPENSPQFCAFSVGQMCMKLVS